MNTVVFVWVATVVGVYLPSPHDKDGWGLRVHNFSVRGPYLVGEVVGRIRFDVTLINFSKEAREHDPLPVARDTGALDITIVRPDGESLFQMGFSAERDPFTQPIRLAPGGASSLDFNLYAFGYRACRFGQVGRYRMKPVMKIDGKTVQGPPVEFEVVEVPTDAVLTSHPVPLEGRGAKESSRPVIQQVPVGNRTLLIYRGPYSTTRLAELPGKCEITVEGAYGAGNPLRIKYKDEKSMTGWTTLVINSISGSSWTDEEERLRIERNKKRDNPPSPPIKP